MTIPREVKSYAFRYAWEVCGHPKENPECWSRVLREIFRKYRRVRRYY